MTDQVAQTIHRGIFGWAPTKDTAFHLLDLYMTKGDIYKAIQAVMHNWHPTALVASHVLSQIFHLRDFVKIPEADKWVSTNALAAYMPDKAASDVEVYALVGPIGKTRYATVSMEELVYNWAMRALQTGDQNGYLQDFLTFACTGSEEVCVS